MTEGLPTPSPRVLIHATAVAVLDAAKPFGSAIDGAVLLLGESGSGKSDVALRLIAAGARLIADDQTALFIRSGRLFAEAPPNLAGCFEVRGIGILRLERAPPSPVILAVNLNSAESVHRLPDPHSYSLPVGLQGSVNVPLLTLSAYEASTPAKIAAAAAGLDGGAFVAGGFSG
jgi:HPr kinase/phosphorylase